MSHGELGHGPTERGDALSRRQFVDASLRTLTAFCLLRGLAAPGALAAPLATEIDGWLRAVDGAARDLRLRKLEPHQWQEHIEALLGRVELDDLLAAIHFETLRRELSYPDLGVDTARARFPGIDMAGLAFHSKVFGVERDRAVLPHGHRNMVSSHLVLGGSFHLRQYERLGEDGDALIVEPTVDTRATAGHASSISDQRNNVHWLIARGGRAWTLDVIVLGLDPDQPSYEIDNLDPHRAERLTHGRLRMPRLGLREALERYGKDHHA